MLLYYHMDPQGNFGDDLNPWLWERLLPGLLQGVYPYEPKMRNTSADGATLFIGIGTLLNQNVPERARKIVFGAGAGYGPPPRIDASWDIACVRGPFTASLLGLDPNVAVTDAAVLVRTIDLGSEPKSRGLAYMPHCSSARNADWGGICERLGIGYIDPQASVDDVLAGIRSAEILITEALHGAIVADALRRPWLPVSTSSGILPIKWHDWCASLGLEYRPAKLPALWRLRDDASMFAKARAAVKTEIVELLLRKLIRNGRPLLSSDKRIANVTDELQERLGRVRQRYSITHSQA